MNLKDLQRLALDVAQALSVDQVLENVVRGLAGDPEVVLARIWLMAPGDICESCALRHECADHSRCLHLRASAGSSRVDPANEWTRIDGAFARFPLGVRKVGKVGGSGEALLARVDDGGGKWLADPDWARAEQVVCFAGQPLVFRDEIVGVLGLFSRRDIDEEDFGWLRTFADQAAVAIANARAFDEVERLRTQLEMECDYLREEIKAVQRFEGIVGSSPQMQKLLDQIEVVAPTDATVLIEGESGTGKELVASAIHERSSRRDRPMVRVNCAAVPGELFESEFFGHLKGAFTGATRDRAGRFEVADSGTLFLDEVGEIPLDLQGKLLRVLQDSEYSRVGEDRVRNVDVRIIAATNRDLRSRVAEGKFREDLYYRLTVFPLEVPSLRVRRGDIPLLAQHFLDCAVRRGLVKDSPGLRKRDARQLEQYDWPGNVRELQSVIERSLILSRGGPLRIEMDPAQIAAGSSGKRTGRERPSPPLLSGSALKAVLSEIEIDELVRQNTLEALRVAGGKIHGRGGAAELLGIKSNTLRSRMKVMGIQGQR